MQAKMLSCFILLATIIAKVYTNVTRNSCECADGTIFCTENADYFSLEAISFPCRLNTTLLYLRKCLSNITILLPNLQRIDASSPNICPCLTRLNVTTNCQPDSS